MKTTIPLILILIFAFSCESELSKKAQPNTVDEITPEEIGARNPDGSLNNLYLSDTVFLKFVLGMTEKEAETHEKVLINSGRLKKGNSPVQPEIETLYTELTVIPDQDKSKVFYQTNYDNNYLVNFDALYTGGDQKSLLYYIQAIYTKKYGEPQRFMMEIYPVWEDERFTIRATDFDDYGILVSYTDNDPDYSTNLERDDGVKETLEDI